MLSGEGNAEQRGKTTIGIISKEATLLVQHTFLYISLPLFARLQRETSKNVLVTRFLEELSYVFFVPFFFIVAHFYLALVAASISHLVTAATKFSFLFSNKKLSPLYFLSVALHFCRPFSR